MLFQPASNSKKWETSFEIAIYPQKNTIIEK